MILETKIQKNGDKLIIVLPKLAVKKAELVPGDLLKILIQGKDMTVVKRFENSKSFEDTKVDINDDIYSKTLLEEELILAK